MFPGEWEDRFPVEDTQPPTQVNIAGSHSSRPHQNQGVVFTGSIRASGARGGGSSPLTLTTL